MSEDDQLMIRLQGGDDSAFREIVERYQAQLIGFFYRNVHDHQLAEDLSQDTLLKVYDQSWDYLPVGRFRGWMYRIGRNLMIDDVRRRGTDALLRASRGGVEEEQESWQRVSAQVVPPDDQADQREVAALVDELLQEIPDDQRQTFMLYHYAGFSLPEVADIMEVPLATSKSRLRLSREKLAEKLRARGVRPLAEE